MRFLIACIFLNLGLLNGGASASDLAVIVNRDSDVTTLGRDDAVNIFMGRYRRLPSGLTAVPIDLASAKVAFYQRLVDRTLAEINSYWARLVFSGRGSPPLQLDTVADVIESVALNRGAIGYVPADQASEQVRVVLILPQDT